MGSTQSSHASNIKDAVSFSSEKEQSTCGVRGRKSPSTVHELSEPTDRTLSTEEDCMEDFVSEDEDDESTDDEEEEDEEEEIENRRWILEDARRLKLLAEMFLHPEMPVKVDGMSMARCYFDRPSASEQESFDESEERARVMEDAISMKETARDFAHPERPVVSSDPTACARCFFDRPSAPEQETDEDAKARARVLADVKALKQAAFDYLHPEAPVVCSDPFACGRNYFTRASAPELVEDVEDVKAIINDARMLKKVAVDYLHPELPVITTDATATARNYFDRPSAPEPTDHDDDEEFARMKQDLEQLKQLAVDYLHPEMPVVTTDPFACGRNYFERPSAPVRCDDEEEHRQILADVAALKKLAVDYAHPEMPVVTNDPAACARNFFARPSAPEQESLDEAEERVRVLEEVKLLKGFAVDYLHPELPVVTSDPCACGRNYFDRPSAAQQEDPEVDEARNQVLEDMTMLRKVAIVYAHPEYPVVTSDPAAFGRNFFARPSASEQQSLEEAIEEEKVLLEAASLKKLAGDFLHPELPVVVTDATACGRNYFDRFSASERESVELAEERVMVLLEAASLKQHATDFMHPELPVVTRDPASFGRNYFTRPSADEQESIDDILEKELVLQDAAMLKQLAVDYSHPELPVGVTDPTVFGRNYFTRSSAPEQEEDSDDRALVFADLATLKQLAVNFAHPELPVVTSDPISFGRNYFTRPSAPEQEFDDERALILADIAALKHLAVDFAHPELPVVTNDPTAFGRNFFTRPSAATSEDAHDMTLILKDSADLKKTAIDFAHPELPCTSTDPTATGRNYFDRPSAPGHTEMIYTVGHQNYKHHDSYKLHGHHDTYKHEDSMHDDSEHHDHFEMDEDIFHDMRESLFNQPTVHTHDDQLKAENEEEEGKLSRSPSSVMLFDQGLEGY